MGAVRIGDDDLGLIVGETDAVREGEDGIFGDDGFFATWGNMPDLVVGGFGDVDGAGLVDGDVVYALDAFGNDAGFGVGIVDDHLIAFALAGVEIAIGAECQAVRAAGVIGEESYFLIGVDLVDFVVG